MKYILTITMIVIASCSYTSYSSGGPKKDVASGNPSIASIATEQIVIEEAATEDIASSLAHIVVIATPTWIPITRIEGNTAPPASAPTANSLIGWQTFTSVVLGVTLDYPPDWSVVEDLDGITFTSPQGSTIRLNAFKPSNGIDETRIGNQYCRSRTNSHQLTADVCIDTISFMYSAKFTIQSMDGITKELTLTTATRSTLGVFEALFNSIRLVQ